MEKILTIFKKELKTYFVTPIAYIVISIFLLIMGWLYFSTLFLNGQANMNQFFSLLPITFAFIIPAITMRLFSEELNIGSYEILVTLPVTFRDIILGKFMAAVAFISVMLSPTIIYALTVSFLGNLDWGPVIGGYLGAILLGATFSSIGIFASLLTRNQVIAFIIGMAICFSLTLLTDFILYFIPNAIVGFLQYFSANFHFQNIAKGVINSRDILYFITISFIALYGSHMVMSNRK